MATASQAKELVRAAIELAIARHDLVPDPEIHDEEAADEMNIADLVDDVWEALLGNVTCAGTQDPSLRSVLEGE